jgi:hypothetical protein
MRGPRVAAAVVAGVCLWGCKTIHEDLPTQPTNTNNPTVTVPVPVIVTPVENPQPQSPSPTPSPNEPNPSPTPSPNTNEPPATQSCAPAPAPGNERCPREAGSDFLPVVESAYDTLIAEHPEWFSGSGDSRKVKISEDEWVWAVINAVRRKGYCAGRYAEEVSVRTSRAYSENFDVLTASYTIRRGEGAYRSTCYPASTTAE